MSNPLKRPRKRPDPSQRDQQILVEYEVHGRTQAELAEKHGLTQCRISQIVRRVKQWRGARDTRQTEGLAYRQQQRLDRWMERERLMTVCREAMRRFHTEQRTVTIERRGSRGDKEFHEVTKRELAANIQWFKVLLQANAQLSRLEEKPFLPPDEPDKREREGLVYQILCELRQEAERAGDVTPSNGSITIVQRWLDALLGLVNPSRKSDPATCELAQAILPECDRLESAPPSAPSLEPKDSTGACGSRSEPRPSDAPTSGDACQPAQPAINSICAAAPQPPQVVAGQANQPKPPAKQSEYDELRATLPDQPATTPEEKARRRELHYRKLQALEEAQRKGLPYSFMFNSDDGPMPRLYYKIDGVDEGYRRPPPPNPNDLGAAIGYW